MTTSSLSPTQTAPRTLDSAAPGACVGDARRIKGLDVLRGIAAASVVVYHYTSNYDRVYHHMSPPAFSFHYGALGVQLFFLISGFVIFMTLERTRRSVDFVRSRFSRLFPAYWAAVLLTFVTLHLAHLPGRTPSVGRAVANLSMIQGLFNVGPVDGVYWTLQVELCFYTIMLLLFATQQLKYAEGWLLGLVGLRLAQIYLHLIPGNSHFLDSHAHIARAVDIIQQVLILEFAYAFLMGIALYKIWRNGHRPAYLVLLALCLLYTYFYGPLEDFLFTLGFVALIYAGSQGYLRFLEFGPLLFLGAISYTLYLTHQNIGYVVIRWAEQRRWNTNLAIATAMLVALGIATVLTFAIERPALRLLRGKRAARNVAKAP
ncbi:MAG TPA: acyltransferase [Tepidisphaeraceae bacterium]|nr:acyltransferase [Tepidisphaeraceae bacterium]